MSSSRVRKGSGHAAAPSCSAENSVTRRWRKASSAAFSGRSETVITGQHASGASLRRPGRGSTGSAPAREDAVQGNDEVYAQERRAVFVWLAAAGLADDRRRHGGVPARRVAVDCSALAVHSAGGVTVLRR